MNKHDHWTNNWQDESNVLDKIKSDSHQRSNDDDLGPQQGQRNIEILSDRVERWRDEVEETEELCRTQHTHNQLIDMCRCIETQLNDEWRE